MDFDLPCDELAAVPEMYYTVWGSFIECLRVERSQTLLIRGTTCALGYASVQLARGVCCWVIATTNGEEKLRLLSDADETVLDNSILRGVVTVDKALEPVRPYTPKDILRLIGPNGMVCDTVILGREYILDGFDPIKEIPNGVYLTGFYSNSPHPGNILSFLDAHGLRPGIGVRFWFSDIGEAYTALDGGRVDGKIVVVMDRWTTWTFRGAK